jgi:outer membrane lipoprotein-sorting protein
MNRIACALLVFGSVASAQDAREIVQEAQNRSQSKSQRYDGTLKVVDAKGKVNTKRWAYERLGSHGSSKSVLRFVAPAEVKGVALLVVNHPDRASDQWMYIPEIGRERRVALQDRSTRFFGTDFTFEDLEERDVNQYEYKLLAEESIEGAPCWKLESRPVKGKSSQYTHSYVWVRKDSYSLARVENYKGTSAVRQLRYGDIRKVQGIWTAHTLDMYDAGRKSHTILTLDKLEYNVALSDDDFTLQSLRRAT